jgi:glycerate-2-kinase
VTPSGGVRVQLERVLRASLAAVDAGAAVSRAVAWVGGGLVVCGSPLAENRRLWVLAAGKAAAAMAAAFEALAGDRIAGGLAITKDGHGVPLERIALREAGHPVPDARSENAAREALALVAGAGVDDALVVLLSGGASSLLACPAPGLSLADIAATTSLLLSAGAGIEELNAVRKHLSAVGGGRLGRRAVSAQIEVLAISDVPGDRIDVIGSGPFAPDPSTFADALEALDRRGVRSRVPVRVAAHLEAGVRGEAEETPKPGDAGLARVRTTLLATNATALAAAAAAAARLGMRPVVVSGSLQGEARDAGRRLAALAAAIHPTAGDALPVCLIAGGETAVTVRGRGRGGRNQELALAAARVLDGRRGIAILAAGTDGSDGPTDAAGAFADGGTLERARARGLDAGAALADNDSYSFFAAEGGLLVTGPTHTNVMDLVLLHIDRRADRRG